jgi:HK97 family phage major capsid protein/HK97 family phage prohead protease
MHQLNNLIGLYMTRDASNTKPLPDFNREALQRTLEVRSFDTDKRTVELAFSSEIEVKRWWGIEILDHDATSVDLSRLLNGGAVLVNHDWDDQVGVVESASVDNDRRGRAVVRFGRSEHASEIFQDIVDGIRRHVSVGYRIVDAKLSETRDEGETDVYRITRWEPYEISIVSVPADPTVGIGRALEKAQEEEQRTAKQTATTDKPAEKLPTKDIRMEKILRDAAGNLVRAMVDADGNITQVLEVLERAGADVESARRKAQEDEQARTASILTMGEKYKCDDLARKAIKDGTTVDQFRQVALEHINSANSNAERSAPLSDGGAQIGLTDKEVRNYSMFNVVRALANPHDRRAQEAASFEFECSRAAEQRTGRTPQGILVPEDVLARAFNAGGVTGSTAGEKTGNIGVDTTFMGGSFIEMLRNRTTLMGLGTSMGGLVGNVDIPRQTGGATAYWIGEAQDATEGSPSLGQLELSPKTVAAFTEITRRLMMQSSLDAEGIVRRDLTNAIAQAIDFAGFYGTGTNNTPRGLKNYTGINSVGFSTNPTFAQLVQMESEIAADNADIGSMAYVMNARMRGYLKTAPKFGTGTESTIWEPGNTVNGYRTEVTNQLANDDVFFGNFSDLLIGLWGGLDLTVDPYSNSKNGSVRIVVFQDVDFALRRVESICYK